MKKLLGLAILTGIMVFGWNYSFLFTNFYTNAQLATSKETASQEQSKVAAQEANNVATLATAKDVPQKEEEKAKEEEAVIAPGLIYIPEEEKSTDSGVVESVSPTGQTDTNDTPIVYDLSDLTQEQQIEVKTDLIEQGYTRAGDVPQDALDQAIINAVNNDTFDNQPTETQVEIPVERQPTIEQEQQIIEQAVIDYEEMSIEEKKEAYLRTLDEEVYESTEIIPDLPTPDVVVYGCMNENACNYNPAAQRSDRSCTYCGSKQICTADQSCCEDPDENGECGDQRVGGCTNRNACNYNPGVDFDDGTCVLPTGCDRSRCPDDGGVAPSYDQCGVCGGNGICEQQVEEEQFFEEPFYEEEIFEEEPYYEEPYYEDDFYAEDPSQDQQPVAYNSEQYEALYPNGKLEEEQEQEQETEHGAAPVENEESYTPTKIPFSIALSDDATLRFRLCLSEERDHTICVYEQLDNPDPSDCKNTLSGYSLGTRIVLTEVTNHTCEEIIETQEPESTNENQEQPTAEIDFFDNEEITTVFIPENPPEEIIYKNDELFVDAVDQKELQEIIDLLNELGVTVSETEQPFSNAGIDTIHLLKISYEKDSTTIEALLEQIYNNKSVQETVTAVPVFKIAQQEGESLEDIVEKVLPYYLEQTKREEFINQCGMPKKKVKIAVIDNAFDTSHEDLQKNIAYAYDVADDDFDTSPPSNGDKAWNHGNIASGIIGATADNEIGILGVANDAVELYLFKATTDQANGEDITAGIEAIAQAIEQDVDIINISRGAYINHPVVRKIIKQAQKEGIIIVAAAGNYDNSEPFYPAAYKNVIGVGALNENNEKAVFSNYGPWVNKTMYGTNIASTDLDNTYDTYDGTSEASPLYAGLLGLGMSYGFTQEQIDAIDRAGGNSLLELTTYCEQKELPADTNNDENTDNTDTNTDANYDNTEHTGNTDGSHGSAPLVIPGDIPGLDVVNGHISSITSYVESNRNTAIIVLLGSLFLNILFFITLLFRGPGKKQPISQES